MIENKTNTVENVNEKEYYDSLQQTIERHMDLYYKQNTNERRE